MPDLTLPFILPGLPGPLTTPTDYTTTGDVTLSQRLNYFENLTIASGHTMTGVAGGTIIVVRRKLTVEGTLSVNALGGKPSSSTGSYGGGAWGRSVSNMTRTQGAFISAGAISATNPYALPPVVQRFMPAGGRGGTSFGVAGSAWPYTAGGVFAADSVAPQDLELWLALLDLIYQAGGKDDATSGAIGGGGGGSGDAVDSVGGILGGRGAALGDAGSGIGGGGGGGAGATTAGVGGRGGGVLLVICGVLSGSGVISANGGAGTNGVTNGGSGGGGGGGGVCVGYHIADVTTPTLQANGGAAGVKAGTGVNGAAGGAGVAVSFRVNVGIASTI